MKVKTSESPLLFYGLSSAHQVRSDCIVTMFEVTFSVKRYFGMKGKRVSGVCGGTARCARTAFSSQATDRISYFNSATNGYGISPSI